MGRCPRLSPIVIDREVSSLHIEANRSNKVSEARDLEGIVEGAGGFTDVDVDEPEGINLWDSPVISPPGNSQASPCNGGLVALIKNSVATSEPLVCSPLAVVRPEGFSELGPRQSLEEKEGISVWARRRAKGFGRFLGVSSTGFEDKILDLL